MVTFDLSFRSMFINEIVEDEGSLWTEGSISWISINRGSYQGNRVQVVDCSFYSSFSVGGSSLEAAYRRAGSLIILSVWLFFCAF